MSDTSHSRDLPAPTSESQLLDWLLAALAPMNRTRVKQLLRSGRVLVNGASVTRHDHALGATDRVSIARAAPPARTPEADRITFLFHDDAIAVIDKPPGLLTVATESEKTDTAFVRLRTHLEATRAGRPFVVHRIDRETSGLLLFAKSPEVRDALQANWDAVTKTYLAIVEGTPVPSEGTIDNFLTEGRDLRVRASAHASRDAKRAVSRYRVASSRGQFSLVEVTIETGRKHQIRVHMAGLRCPVIGDATYGAATNPAGRLGLHAWKLALDHPKSGERIELESPLPASLRRVIEG